jgi:hypothetical protein
MPWYLAAYLLLFVGVSAAGLVDDWISRRSRLYVLAMALTLAVGIVGVLAFAIPKVAAALGAWLWPLLAFAVAMELWSAVSDLRDPQAADALTRGQKAATVAALALVTTPAYVLGAIAATRAAA